MPVMVLPLESLHLHPTDFSQLVQLRTARRGRTGRSNERNPIAAGHLRDITGHRRRRLIPGNAAPSTSVRTHGVGQSSRANGECGGPIARSPGHGPSDRHAHCTSTPRLIGGTGFAIARAAAPCGQLDPDGPMGSRWTTTQAPSSQSPPRIHTGDGGRSERSECGTPNVMPRELSMISIVHLGLVHRCTG